MRINKYLAQEGLCTRREADRYIEEGLVYINGKRAELGSQVAEGDRVETQFGQKDYRYYAYHKAKGIVTHSPEAGQKGIAEVSGLPGLYPMGRLDKQSRGLIILTNDGRITEKLLGPEAGREKEYVVVTKEHLPPSFKTRMEQGVNIGGYNTKPAKVKILGDHQFSIILTEGKKHQIRRMCEAWGYTVGDLKRIRVMNIKLGPLQSGQFRQIKGLELKEFLKELGMQ
ncbi:MAG TPA: pseudouridine synthase [Candidatus Paceibacterota bacterium]|jgi:23S rRNA pseudouridine2604 synthase|nr:pseudouridine synthase [Candidatus Paceibacterota bacterium]